MLGNMIIGLGKNYPTVGFKSQSESSVHSTSFAGIRWDWPGGNLTGQPLEIFLRTMVGYAWFLVVSKWAMPL